MVETDSDTIIAEELTASVESALSDRIEALEPEI